MIGLPWSQIQSLPYLQISDFKPTKSSHLRYLIIAIRLYQYQTAIHIVQQRYWIDLLSLTKTKWICFGNEEACFAQHVEVSNSWQATCTLYIVTPSMTSLYKSVRAGVDKHHCIGLPLLKLHMTRLATWTRVYLPSSLLVGDNCKVSNPTRCGGRKTPPYWCFCSTRPKNNRKSGQFCFLFHIPIMKRFQPPKV